MVQARLCIEPPLAREAAIHASRSAITNMNQAINAARAATTWAEYEIQDDLFHRAIAEASDNILLLTLFDHFNAVRREVSGGNVVRATQRPTPEHKSFDEHDRIAAAIQARDPHAAQLAMRNHIGSVSDRLFRDV
jgi:DNA-binding FadR family transcriptional regulator